MKSSYETILWSPNLILWEQTPASLKHLLLAVFSPCSSAVFFPFLKKQNKNNDSRSNLSNVSVCCFSLAVNEYITLEPVAVSQLSKSWEPSDVEILC